MMLAILTILASDKPLLFVLVKSLDPVGKVGNLGRYWLPRRLVP